MRVTGRIKLLMGWLWRRLQDILPGGQGEGDAYPKERYLCVASTLIRLGFTLAPALAMWEWLQGWPWWFRGSETFGAGLVGLFVYADLGPEEWFRRWTVGYSWNPNIWPLGTMEGFCGAIHPGFVRVWESLKIVPMRPWDGQPGRGVFGDE